MSRNLSERHRRSANARETDDCWVSLLVIEHASMEEPLRFNNSGAEIVSNGEVYSPFPFVLILPEDSEEAVGQARLIIDNSDREIMTKIRGLRPEPLIAASVVIAETPDVVEIQLPPLPLKNISYDDFMVEGQIAAEDYAGEPFPAGKFTPADFPGMF